MRWNFPAVRRAVVAAAVLLAGAAGCDSNPRTYPVHGKVMLEDGRLVTRGVVLFEGASGGALVAARGTITPNGTYEMSTYKPGDGVPPGKYRVQINPIDLSDTPDEQKNLPFDVKYTNPSDDPQMGGKTPYYSPKEFELNELNAPEGAEPIPTF